VFVLKFKTIFGPARGFSNASLAVYVDAAAAAAIMISFFSLISPFCFDVSRVLVFISSPLKRVQRLAV
jgi:hypothetical protein